MCVDGSGDPRIITACGASDHDLRLSEDADVRVDYQQIGRRGKIYAPAPTTKSGCVTLNAPGRHNALNAAAAVAVATEEKLTTRLFCVRWRASKWTGRRFDFLGEFPLEPVNGKSGTAMLVDDYGHHPASEVDATIKRRVQAGRIKTW